MRPAQSRWYAAAAALGIALAAVGGWYRARQASPPPGTSGTQAGGTGSPRESLQQENARLRREVAALRAQVAGVRQPGQAASPDRPGEDRAAALPGTPGIPAEGVEELLAKAQVALKSDDADAFVDAFDALMDAGEDAYPGIIALVQDIGEDQSIFRSPKAWDAARRYRRNLFIRAPQLEGLLDTILLRDGKPDQATQFALDLFQQGASSGLPRERQIAILLGLLASPMDDANTGHQIRWQSATVLAMHLKAAEALPELERLYLAASGNERQSLLGAWPLSGPGCAASLKRLLDQSQDGQDRTRLIHSLGRIEGAEANETLWALVQRGGHANEQASALAALAKRPENLDRIVQEEFKNPQCPPQQRNQLLWSLMQSAHTDKAAKQRLWELYDNDPTLRDDLIHGFLAYQDPRAKQVLGEALRSGQMSDAMTQYLASLDADLLRERASTLSAMAGNPQGSLETRMGAYSALARVDRPAATDALLNGFTTLSEENRLHVFSTLANNADDATRQRLRQLAENDPSPEVKEAAKGFGFDNP